MGCFEGRQIYDLGPSGDRGKVARQLQDHGRFTIGWSVVGDQERGALGRAHGCRCGGERSGKPDFCTLPGHFRCEC